MDSSPQTALLVGLCDEDGADISIALAKNGWDVALQFHRAEATAAALRDKILEYGTKVALLSANVNIPGDLQTLVQRSQDALGRPIGAMIYKANARHIDPTETFSNALFDHHMDANLRAPLSLSHAVAVQMPRGSQGALIHIVGSVGHSADPTRMTGSLSQSALLSATQLLAQNLSPYLRVNSIVKAQATPSDITQATLYLLSAQAITGQSIVLGPSTPAKYEAMEDQIKSST